MEQRTPKLNPCAPILVSDHDLEQRLEKTLNGVNIINISIKNIEEMITYFKDENHKSKKKYEKIKMLLTKIISFDTFVIIATTSSSIALTVTGIGLKVIPNSVRTASGLSNGNKVIYEIVLQKYNKDKKQYRKD